MERFLRVLRFLISSRISNSLLSSLFSSTSLVLTKGVAGFKDTKSPSSLPELDKVVVGPEVSMGVFGAPVLPRLLLWRLEVRGVVYLFPSTPSSSPVSVEEAGEVSGCWRDALLRLLLAVLERSWSNVDI